MLHETPHTRLKRNAGSSFMALSSLVLLATNVYLVSTNLAGGVGIFVPFVVLMILNLVTLILVLPVRKGNPVAWVIAIIVGLGGEGFHFIVTVANGNAFGFVAAILAFALLGYVVGVILTVPEPPESR